MQGVVIWVKTKIRIGNGFNTVIPKTLKMLVVPACVPLSMKYEPRNMTGQPGVSIM